MNYVHFLVLGLLLQLFIIIGNVSCENILFYFVITGYSHVNSIWPLAEKLLDEGHNITVLSSFVPKSLPDHENLTVVLSTEVLAIFSEFWDEGSDLIQARKAHRHYNVLDPLSEVGYHACKIILESPSTKNVVYNSQFDLVILDEEANQCGMAMAHLKYKAPFIIYSAFTFCTFMYDEYGIPVDLSVPDNEYGVQMSYWERVKTMYRTLKWSYEFQRYTFEPMGELVKKAFSLDCVPSISDLYLHTSLVFINIHPSTDYPRSLPLLFVPVAGMQITEKRKPLPYDLNKFISMPSSEGFIYISFGTSVQISKSNHEIREKFFNTFGNMTNLQFVWKWEGEIPKNAGNYPNIYFSNWLPQQDLIAHKRVKGYVSHGGINGMHEAIYYQVPTIFFPIVYEQDFNALSIVNKGAAIVMEISTFTQKELENAVNQLLTNSMLKQNMIKVSNLFKDRPMKPVDTAFWYTNYVLRNKNASGFLVPMGKHQTWYERRHLDIWLPVFVLFTSVLIAFGYLLYKLVCIVLNLTYSRVNLTLSQSRIIKTTENAITNKKSN